MIHIQKNSRVLGMLVGAANIIDGIVRVASLGILFTRLPAKALGLALRIHFDKCKRNIAPKDRSRHNSVE